MNCSGGAKQNGDRTNVASSGRENKHVSNELFNRGRRPSRGDCDEDAAASAGRLTERLMVDEEDVRNNNDIVRSVTERVALVVRSIVVVVVIIIKRTNALSSDGLDTGDHHVKYNALTRHTIIHLTTKSLTKHVYLFDLT